ncbi:MAG: RNA recognition motif domain-containing protein [Candidatus Nanoarchaeia archaeon]
MKIFVGNLPWAVDDAKLKDMFSQFGDVSEASIITDRFTKRSKGFGFVTFGSDEAAEKAIQEMNGKEVEGRELKVDKAKPKEE